MWKIKDLSSFPLFQEMTPAQLHQIEELGEDAVFSDGQRLFSETEDARYLTLIRTGRVSLQMELPNAHKVTLFTVEPGEVLGWSALHPDKKYTASALAVGRVEALRIEGVKLVSLFESDPYLGYIVYRQLLEEVANRLDEARSRIASLLTTGALDS